MPDSNTTNLDKTISDTCRVKYRFVHMNASISGTNRLTCVGAASSPVFNGSYLFFEDDWSTVANMDMNRKVVVSGKFSGCRWRVFRSQEMGVFKCTHIARPGGVGSDALVSLITDGYGVQNQWALVHELSTAGRVGVNGCVEVFVVSQLFPGQRIDSIAIDVNNQGLVVGRQFVSTPI
jgi:hypothetical protein